MIGTSLRSISANASSHDTSTNSPSRFDEGATQPVGIFVELLQRRPLGADEAVTEDIRRGRPAPARSPRLAA